MATPPDAPYRLRQRLAVTPRVLAVSAELSAYEKKHKTSALRIARLAKEQLGKDR